MAKKTEPKNIVLPAGNWRTIIDEVAAFHFTKSTQAGGRYQMTIVLRGSGYEIVETVTKEEMIEFGKAYVERVNWKYGTEYKAFEGD